MAAAIADQAIQGVLLGGLYCMFALGLSLTVGVLRFVNIAHGDLIVLLSFLTLAVCTGLGIHPLLSLVLVVPLSCALFYALQRLLLQRVTGQNPLLVLLITFGIAIIIQNGLLQGFGADTRKLPGGALETATWQVAPGLYVGILPLLTLLTAIVMVWLLDLLLYRSRLGARIRAASDDVAAANLIGLPTPRIFAAAMAVVGATAAVAACFMGLQMNFDPASGPSRLLIAFEAVVLGGLGSLWGTLAGGIVLGVAQSIGGEFDAAWQAIAGHAAFLLIFLLRPQGFFPKY
ncbi:branched-chain amino acid ABC transporter permease [Rhodopila globiformis]|uniref:Branched-chain amino acid ABC transporter permease n=1 Tax=Rhodopila globiformis TaxID=1071 RepID=A0A2S6NNP0_RHOGL|nr:branched-chain amino acid ABC transporter permease [Rhodopila globiformis]PPQ39025.1 branched-chain amino acid ABC transporter permease [Rhodopila globiformis]